MILRDAFPSLKKDLYAIDFYTNPFFEKEADVTYVPLSKLTNPNIAIPKFHSFSLSHYQSFLQSQYASVLTYHEFCVLEEHLALIVFHYLNDMHHHWLLLIDPCFLSGDSLKSYGNQEAIHKTIWISPSAHIGDPDFVLWKIPDTQTVL